MYTDCGLSQGNLVLLEMAAEANHLKDKSVCIIHEILQYTQ